MAIEPELLEILRCPESHASLVVDGDFLVSTDPATRRRYAVVDDIPNMIVEESEVLDEAAWAGIMERHGVMPRPKGDGGDEA
jgi:uncharacterized protein YbaR (Trm112 family)